jgi:hypothetical protein
MNCSRSVRTIRIYKHTKKRGIIEVEEGLEVPLHL